MEKKTCSVCGKIWILEKFDQHTCVPLPKKTRKSSGVKKAKEEKKVEGPPLVTFHRI